MYFKLGHDLLPRPSYTLTYLKFPGLNFKVQQFQYASRPTSPRGRLLPERTAKFLGRPEKPPPRLEEFEQLPRFAEDNSCSHMCLLPPRLVKARPTRSGPLMITTNTPGIEREKLPSDLSKPKITYSSVNGNTY